MYVMSWYVGHFVDGRVHYLLSVLYKSFSDVCLLQTLVLWIIPQQDEEWGEEERLMQMQEGEEEHRKKI